MLFLKVDVLELDEARERERIDGAFEGANRETLLAVLDHVVAHDLPAACQVFNDHHATYTGDTPFAEYLHPVVYELMAGYIQRKNWLALYDAAQAEGTTPAVVRQGLEWLSGRPADLRLRMTYPRLVPFTGQLDLESLS